MPPLHGSWGGERVRESEEGERRTARSNTYIHSDTYCSFESYSLLERFLETISSLLSSRGEILRPSGHLRRTARRSGTWETSSSAHRRTLRRVASHRVTLTIPTMVVENIANVCRPATSNEIWYSRRQSSDNLVVVIVAAVLLENRFVRQFFTNIPFKNMRIYVYLFI